MDPDEGPLQMERENTDESLRNERTKTDEELGARLRVIEEGTADAVDNARKDADAVIAAFRTTADQRAGSSGGLAPANSTVQKARAAEDARTARERAAADEELHDKRADDITTLLRLLPMEREKTDQHLLTEREQADEAISQRDDFSASSATICATSSARSRSAPPSSRATRAATRRRARPSCWRSGSSAPPRG